LKALTKRQTQAADYPRAGYIQNNVPVYDGSGLADCDRKALMGEWADVLLNGPGIIAIKHAFPDTAPIDRATAVFETIIAAEKAAGASAADHFAKPGANDRIWNVLEKHCLADPEGFASYFANPAIATVAEAWLGPAYQMTAQMNRVNPGGTAQSAHRDYHLGFMTATQSARYPAHVHALSPALTLQGAVAHCDMPLESGPTLYLPFSQHMEAGYLAFPRPEFQEFFQKNHMQLPLEKGDAVFFNPALMHAAGTNTSKDIYRMANLLQVSSAFGRAMETVNRTAMCLALYPTLLASDMDIGARTAVIAAAAEGYAFPTNLDRDPPIDGLAPASQADLMHKALQERTSAEAFHDEMTALSTRRTS
jgi:ectoine hydroxylase-related dioxygenase (phytanoyl-CoA dioxygenase family)